MPLFNDAERRLAGALSGLSYCNPFLPERIDLEKEALGDEFAGCDVAWHKHADESSSRTNLERLAALTEALADELRGRLAAGASCDDTERALYEDVVLYHLYYRYQQAFHALIQDGMAGGGAGITVDFYAPFRDDMAHYLDVGGAAPEAGEAAHVFACYFQVRRAFTFIYDNIIGGSMASARLRAAVWQSIFTNDMRRFRRSLYARMGEITTLITGPSGTGKELVARAIGLSRYIPFDEKRNRFAASFAECLHPVNISALSPTLVESELFGHVKGAFTGAIADRAGFFEVCPAEGAVFLDEIGDLAPAIQVKLLRVLQTGAFQRIGDTAPHRFDGKIIAATNRDLNADMREGRFRTDLYYRLCSDIVVTPSLREQIDGAPEQLANLLRFIARRAAGGEEAETLANETAGWIANNLPPDYPWPGNVRELEQCVRNVMVRGAYQPPHMPKQSARQALLDEIGGGRLTAEEALRLYCTLIYAETGSYQEAARRLGLDRRTVKSRIDAEWLERLME